MRNRREFIVEIIGTLSATFTTGSLAWAMKPTDKAVDSHAHIFLHTLPMAQQHRYIPEYDAPLSKYLDLLDKHSMSNGVLVQPSFLGTDNSFMLAALESQRERLRGIAVIDPATDLSKLGSLHDSGCVGIRLNLIGSPDPDFTKVEWKPIFEKLRELNWLVEVQVEAKRLRPVVEPLLRENLRVVIDHFGRPDPTVGTKDEGFRYLLSQGKTRQVWVKVSGAYRNGGDGRGEQIALDALPQLRDSFGLKHLVWGSDWPHTQFESVTSYDAAYQLLLKMLPEQRDRQVVLWDSPAELFGFAHHRTPIHTAKAAARAEVG